MKRIFIVLTLIGFVNCKEAPKKEATPETSIPESESGEKESMEMEDTEKEYPEALSQVLEAHGGLQNWKDKRTLTFTIPKPDAAETHTVDLYSRKDKIVMPTASMGSNGDTIWLMDEGDSYEGNPAVYHNLMFYFYAMPFVLADDGIVYGDAEPLEFEGKSYPGIHISYDAGIGSSPKDDYYLYYDPETHQMAWLGYTFTFGSDEKSDDVRYIRYADWMKVDDVMLPKTLTWYDYEGSTIEDAKDSLPFENVTLSETAKPDDFYAMPENAKEVE
ncbi:MAG: DUF6503 family protein [Pricia sp.]